MHTNINFYEHDLNVYEYLLTQLKNDLIAHHYPQIYYCNAGTFLNKERFLKQEFISDRIFVFVDDHFPEKEIQVKMECMLVFILMIFIKKSIMPNVFLIIVR